MEKIGGSSELSFCSSNRGLSISEAIFGALEAKFKDARIDHLGA
jgi:hypothetical protein